MRSNCPMSGNWPDQSKGRRFSQERSPARVVLTAIGPGPPLPLLHRVVALQPDRRQLGPRVRRVPIADTAAAAAPLPSMDIYPLRGQHTRPHQTQDRHGERSAPVQWALTPRPAASAAGIDAPGRPKHLSRKTGISGRETVTLFSAVDRRGADTSLYPEAGRQGTRRQGHD